MRRIDGGVAQNKGLVYKPNIAAMEIMSKISPRSDPDKKWEQRLEAFRKIDNPRTERDGNIY